MLETKETHKARVKEQKEMMRKIKMNTKEKENNSQQTKPPIKIGEPEIVSKDDFSNRLGARDKTADTYSKQKALERLREIEEGCRKEFILGTEVNSKGEFKRDIKEICGNYDKDYEILFLCSNCKKEAQKIKDDWEDGCGSNDFDKKRDYCGLVTKYLDKNNKLQRKKVYFCPTCKTQNKEKEEICGRILG